MTQNDEAERLIAGGMKRHKNQIKHDPENGMYGDCHRACMATILGMEPDDVPHFYGDPSKDGNAIIRDFLAPMGLMECSVFYPGELDLDMILMTARNTMAGVPMILGGKSRTGCNHSVVLLDGEIYNDPAETGIIGPLSNGYYILTILAARPGYAAMIRTQAARIAELEAKLQAVLRREEDANKAAFAHMRRITALEADGIAARRATAKNYARAEAAEAALAEAEARGYARAVEDAASEIDCGGCKASITGCLDPSNCWHDEANAIRALAKKEAGE